MIIAALIYPGFTMLDLVGPIEILSMIPDAEVRIVAAAAGVVWPDNQAVPFVAPYAMGDVAAADILIVPGGPGCMAVMQQAEVLDWVRRIHAGTRHTASVCTGAMILAAAGLLTGAEATTHWTCLPALEAMGVRAVSQRWVQHERIITAAGVSAGIDMALMLAAMLAGERVARAAQLAVEYDPHPPFDSGAHETASDDCKAALFDGTIAFDRQTRPRPAMPDGWRASPAPAD